LVSEVFAREVALVAPAAAMASEVIGGEELPFSDVDRRLSSAFCDWRSALAASRLVSEVLVREVAVVALVAAVASEVIGGELCFSGGSVSTREDVLSSPGPLRDTCPNASMSAAACGQVQS
jgi:hypothetical protein